MAKPAASAKATYKAPNPFAMLFHLGKTFALTGSVLSDKRVHVLRKGVFVTIMFVLVAAVLGSELAAEVVTNIVPVFGQVVGLGELPVDATFDWVFLSVAAFNMMKLFPAEIVGEHYDRLFRRKRSA